MTIWPLYSRIQQPFPHQGTFYKVMCMAPTLRQREAIIQVYAFCQHVDHIADSDIPASERYEKLSVERERLNRCYSPVLPKELSALHAHIHHFRLPKVEFEIVFTGMLQDVSGEMVYPDQLTFDAYIDHVSCSIGRLLIPILSLEEARYRKMSHHAGIAIQLTNTLRDIDENLTLGFLYLPGSW